MTNPTRAIIHIAEEKCNGCGLCASACAEGAIQIIDGKAKLVSDNYCDGLGACLGTCPMDAIWIEERTAAPFDPAAVEEHLAAQDVATPAAEAAPKVAAPPPRAHGPGHGHAGCPGSMARLFARPAAAAAKPAAGPPAGEAPSRLEQWPVQLHLVPANAPYWAGAELLVAADCTAFALGAFHERLLKGRRLMIACPKLDDKDGYLEKLTAILRDNPVRGITVAIMEVPCCQGLRLLVEQALRASGKVLPYRVVTVTLEGEVAE
ncbi:MAG: 4Fe-4S binding protein [Lentisphaeria bacterium]|jgi:Pyruvate/2-oxoacid:ferredoxin oxidoreductase delta subunit